MIDSSLEPRPLERVHTIEDYYDGPRYGVADFDGRPHTYTSLWVDIDSDLEDTFILSPINDEAFALALEDWDIWLRWSCAFKAGTAPEDTHPALPQDRARHTEIQLRLAELLAPEPAYTIQAEAEFHGTLVSAGSLLVRWTVLRSPPSVA